MAEDVKNTLSEISDEVKATVASRLRSPLLGVFSLSWIVWNHRLLFVLFSDAKVSERFAYIDKHLYPSASEFAWLNLIGPTISTLIYIAAVPWLSEKALVLNLWYQRRQKAAELRSEAHELLTEKQSLVLRQKLTARDEVIKGLKEELAVQQRKVIRHEVLAALSGGANSETLNKILRKYLTAEIFAEKAHYSTGSQGLVKFDEQGYVHTRSGGVGGMAFESVERWAQSKGKFILYSADQKELGSLEFQSDMGGFFFGRVDGVDRVLISHSE